MPDFHTTIEDAIRASGMSKIEISQRLGRTDGYISTMLSKGSDPGFSVVIRIAGILGLTTDELANIGPRYSVQAVDSDTDVVAAHAEKLLNQTMSAVQKRISSGVLQPTIEDIMEWWLAQGGVLSGMDQIAQFFDLYKAPSADDNTAISHSMGGMSLATKSFGFSNSGELNTVLRSLEPGYAKDLVIAQRYTLETFQPKLSVEEIDVLDSGTGKEVRFPYSRLYLPVRDKSKREYVLNFSQRLPYSLSGLST